MDTCGTCGEAIQYEAGKLTQTEFSLEGVGEEYRCLKCAGPLLAEMVLQAESAKGSYHYGAVQLAWELQRDEEAPSGMTGQCLRSFLKLLFTVMEKFPVGRRARAERALRDLVGPAGPHAQTCDCRGREAGDLCPWCCGRLTLKAAK